MRRAPKQGFDEDLKKAIYEYHEWHHDRHVEIIRFVCDNTGFPLILTRVVDEDGVRMSCLLEHTHFSRGWDVMEREHCERQDEFEMVQAWME